MTVFVNIPMVPFVLSVEGGELSEVQAAFEKIISRNGSAAFPISEERVFILNMSRIPFIVCSTEHEFEDDKPLNLVSIEQVRRIVSAIS